MFSLKPKMAGGIFATLLVAGGFVMASVPRSDSPPKLTAKEIIVKTQHAYAALSSYSDSGTSVARMGSVNGGMPLTLRTTFSIHLQRPDLYCVQWSESVFDGMTAGGATWSDGKGSFLVMNMAHHHVKQKYTNNQLALAAGAGVSSGASSTIPGIFFAHKKMGDVLESANATLKKGKDQTVRGIDCYVVSWHNGAAVSRGKKPGKTPSGTTFTLWIEKGNFFIRRIREVITKGPPIPHVSDAQIKKTLVMLHKPATPAAIASLRKELKASKMPSMGAITFTETHDRMILNKSIPPSVFVPH